MLSATTPTINGSCRVPTFTLPHSSLSCCARYLLLLVFRIPWAFGEHGECKDWYPLRRLRADMPKTLAQVFTSMPEQYRSRPIVIIPAAEDNRVQNSFPPVAQTFRGGRLVLQWKA